MPAGRLLRTKISIPGSGDFTIISSVTSCCDCAFALLAMTTPANAMQNAATMDLKVMAFSQAVIRAMFFVALL